MKKLIRRQHIIATISPASMLKEVRACSKAQPNGKADEVVFVIGYQPLVGRRVRLIAEEFARAGKPVRVIRTL